MARGVYNWKVHVKALRKLPSTFVLMFYSCYSSYCVDLVWWRMDYNSNRYACNGI